MKQYRSILSALFALLVLLASSNFMIGIHLCGGRIQNMALFNKAEGCAMEKKLPPCHRHESAPCCQDETIAFEAQDFNSDITPFHVAPIHGMDVDRPLVLLAEVIPSAVIPRLHYPRYEPPLRTNDLTVALRVFLI
jgi:hypothetical protein